DFNTVWFANDGAPVLRVFYTIGQGHNEVAHYEAATRYAGVMLEVKGTATAHSFVADTENADMEKCSVCGYSQAAAVDVLGILLDKGYTNVVAILQADQVFLKSFSTNADFLKAYKADNNISKYEDPVYMYGSSLNLKSKPYIAFTFAITDKSMWESANVSFTFTTETGYNKTVTAAEATHNDGAGRYHTVRLKDIPVVNLRDVITVTANYNGTTYQMGTYSAAGFAINAINAGTAYKDYAAAAKGVVYYSELLAARLENVTQ
ncbi:MAG: hypothetical protein Q4B40_06370, partial [Clostridia bacterium]|nr:hypothetical protein [Clostridia bacterium]